MKDNQIWKIYGTAYKEMTVRLLKSTDLAGRIRDRKRRICIKPNLVCPSPADFGATTHPEIVAGIIEYLRENGFDSLMIRRAPGWGTGHQRHMNTAVTARYRKRMVCPSLIRRN